MQFVDQPDQQPLLIGPYWVIRFAEDRGAYLFRGQFNAAGEERDMYPPLVSAAAARASAVDHELPAANCKRAAVEQDGGTEAVIDARYAGKSSEQRKRRYA